MADFLQIPANMDYSTAQRTPPVDAELLPPAASDSAGPSQRQPQYLGPGRLNLLCDRNGGQPAATPQSSSYSPSPGYSSFGYNRLRVGASVLVPFSPPASEHRPSGTMPPSPESPSIVEFSPPDSHHHYMHYSTYHGGYFTPYPPCPSYATYSDGPMGPQSNRWDLLVNVAGSAEPIKHPALQQSPTVQETPATRIVPKKRLKVLSQAKAAEQAPPSRSASADGQEPVSPDERETSTQASASPAPEPVRKRKAPTRQSVKKSSRRRDSDDSDEDYSSELFEEESSDGDRRQRKRKKATVSTRKEDKKSSSKFSKAETQEKEYRCEWVDCGKVFTTSGHLARHLRIHSGAKPYKCLVADCESRFSRQDNMMQHYRTHIIRASGSFMHATQPSAAVKPFRLHVDTGLIDVTSVDPSAEADNEADRASEPAAKPKSRKSGFSKSNRKQNEQDAEKPNSPLRTTVVMGPPRDGSASDVQLFGEPKKAAAFWSKARSGSKKQQE
ncbi:hypothetical protein HDU96_003586 [Phlyctochytrium bullatum]|nr:hypothetical protein HDU96_003586 [Phlyctochytrium bullatum]